MNVSFKLTTMLKYTALLLVTTHLFACMISLGGRDVPAVYGSQGEERPARV